MKTLTHYEIEILRKEKYSQFKTKQEFVYWLSQNDWVTVTSKHKKRSKRYQVCERVL